MATFSKRHRRALREKSLNVELVSMVRGRVNRLLERYNASYSASTDTGWNYETDTLEDLADQLGDLYGSKRLPGEEGEGFSRFIERAPGEFVFDAVELFASINDDNSFIGELNEVLAEEEVPWRLLNGEVVLLDETFARSQLASRADESLLQSGFDGANLELRRSRHHIVDGDGRAAVHRAGSAYESVMMALLEADRGKGSKLLQKLNQEGYFNDLPVKLRQPFIREVLESLPWMRNELGAHGQGELEVEVPRPYAQLATDLASAFCHFLVTLKLEREGKPAHPTDDSPSAGSPSDEVADVSDFSFTTASEDDIPF